MNLRVFPLPLLAALLFQKFHLSSSFQVVTTQHSVVQPLYATQQRQPRRSLKKRRRRRGEDAVSSKEDDFPWETAESRPLVPSYAKEMGEDYWMDEEELRKEQAHQAALKAIEPGQIPQEKLWTEVLSPYRQNWIGLISVGVIVLAFIFQYFPEVISPPLIANVPDL